MNKDMVSQYKSANVGSDQIQRWTGLTPHLKMRTSEFPAKFAGNGSKSGGRLFAHCDSTVTLNRIALWSAIAALSSLAVACGDDGLGEPQPFSSAQDITSREPPPAVVPPTNERADDDQIPTSLPPDDDSTTSDAGATKPKPLSNPVVPQDCADPHVLFDGGKWHAFCTQAANSITPHYVTDDLQTWRNMGSAVPKIASWVEYGLNWAPSVTKFGSNYVMYYAARRAGTGQHCLGRAVSKSINGPFVDELSGPFVCAAGGYWSIDPSRYTAPSGKRYLLWRQDTAAQNKGNVAVRELSDDGRSFASGSETRILLSKQNGTWEDPVMENPSMFYFKGKYYLFYSANAWDTGSYGIGYAECSSVTGPCTKKTTKGPWFSTFLTISGPGGQDFFTDSAGNAWISMHGWTTGKVGYDKGGARSLWVFRFGIEADGPHIYQPIPSEERAN